MENPHLQVETEAAGTRLDAFLAAKLGVSRSRAQKIVETALVNGKSTKASHALREGDEVSWELEIENQETEKWLLTPNSQLLTPEILFEDEHLLVLNKSRGLSVHPGAGEPEMTLVDVLKAQNVPLSGVGPVERAGIVHRLDKDTSGAMIVCKTDAAHQKLAADFHARRIEKTYEAIACGIPAGRGRVEAPIGRLASNRKKMAVVATGRPSITEYETLRAWERFAFLKINLLTGRTHQIRVHLAYVHHPVAGDVVYGGLHRALDNAPNPAARAAIENLNGQALHAAKIAFFHPISGEKMEFEAPMAAEMRDLIAALG